MQGCWASFLGDCEGPLTGEHLVTRAVLGTKTSVRGFNWCPQEFKNVGTAALTCNCLCGKHNSSLSPVDYEIIKWKNAIERTSVPRPKKSLPFLISLDGLLLGRWLAKTACTHAATDDKHVPAPLARYAFAQEDDPSIRVYCAFTRGEGMIWDTRHVGSNWLHRDGDEDQVAVHFSVFDFSFVIATFSLRPFWPDLAPLLNFPMSQAQVLMDRLARVEIRGATRSKPRGWFYIHWNDKCRERP